MKKKAIFFFLWSFLCFQSFEVMSAESKLPKGIFVVGSVYGQGENNSLICAVFLSVDQKPDDKALVVLSTPDGPLTLTCKQAVQGLAEYLYLPSSLVENPNFQNEDMFGYNQPGGKSRKKLSKAVPAMPGRAVGKIRHYLPKGVYQLTVSTLEGKVSSEPVTAPGGVAIDAKGSKVDWTVGGNEVNLTVKTGAVTIYHSESSGGNVSHPPVMIPASAFTKKHGVYTVSVKLSNQTKSFTGTKVAAGSSFSVYQIQEMVFKK